MPLFEAHGITFHFADDNNDRIPFVFQHGLGADIRQPMAFFGEDRPFRLISLDCRGHGKTRPLGDRQFLKFNSLSDDITNLLGYLNLSKVVIGGISMGAGVALNFAVRHPERTRALILSRASWLTEPLPPNLTVFPKIGGLIREYGAQRGKELFLSTAEYGQVLAREISGARFAEITAKAISEQKHVEDVRQEISQFVGEIRVLGIGGYFVCLTLFR
jgi:pimeloyl-ACP methyl ester carboxylesterase